jgi:predicted esterase YcpF (UPF0227 family)
MHGPVSRVLGKGMDDKSYVCGAILGGVAWRIGPLQAVRALGSRPAMEPVR